MDGRKLEKGESSRKTSLTGDENERPLKKAKYVWQLKGKYHLKEQYKQSGSNETSQDEAMEKEVPNLSEVISSNAISHQKKCCMSLDNLIAHSNSLLNNEDLSDQESTFSNIDRTVYDDIPISLVHPHTENHDELLEKWQARQVAKSFIDNTINTILEQCKLAPAEALDFVENCENGHVEDEGIMMAIQSHGLQSNMPRHLAGLDGELCSSNLINLDRVLIPQSGYAEESKDNFRNKHYEHSVQKNMDIGIDGDKDSNRNETEQMEFLSTAVSMAIRKKGLSSYNYG